MAPMRSSTACLAPSPMASIAITEPTPMTMPSSVSTVRNRLARSARSAMRKRFARVAPRARAPSARLDLPRAIVSSVAALAAALNAGPGSLTIVAVLDLDDAVGLRGDVLRHA